MRFKELEKAYDEVISKKTQIEQEIKEQEAQKAQKEQEAREAAAAGDVATYKQIKAEITGLEDSIFVKRAQLKKCAAGALKESEVLPAWNKYASDYGKKFEKLLADYEKARHALFVMYMEIVDLQNEALRTRERCGYLMGVDPLPNNTTNGNEYFKKMRMRTLETGTPIEYAGSIVKTTPDTAFFSSYGEVDRATADELGRVIYFKQSI